MDSPKLRDFLEIPYDRLEELNLNLKEERLRRVSPDRLREQRSKALADVMSAFEK